MGTLRPSILWAVFELTTIPDIVCNSP